MKSIITIVVLPLFLSLLTFSQDRIHRGVIPEKLPTEKLREIHKPNANDFQGLNDIDSLLLKSQNNTWQTALRNPKREFSKEKGFNAKDTRTTINKTLLGDGFLFIEEYDQYWDISSAAWVNHWKDSYTYDGNNNLNEWLWQYWSGSAWRNNSKTSYTYDGNNNQIATLEQNWSYSAWRNSWKTSYTYDGNNNLNEWLWQYWSGSTWSNSGKYSYTYDGNNNQIEALWHTWDGSEWVIDYKYSFTYDGNNNLTESLYQYWSVSDSDWVNIEKYSYTYNGNNNLTEYFYQYWHDYDSTWQNLEKYLYTYDGNSNLTEELYQMGRHGFDWENFLKTFYTYDVNNSQFESFTYIWDGFGWVIYYKVSYIYDGNNYQTELLVQDWDGFNWVNFYKIIYSYLPTDVEEFTSEFNDYSLSNNFPNPFNPSTKITYTIPERTNVSLKVFDLLGSEVAELVKGELDAGTYDITFNLANLPSGVYFYRLQAGPFIQTRKMILLK